MNVEQWLGADNQLGIDIITKKYMRNATFDKFITRISNGDEHLERIILEKKYLHGGRTLSNYNTNNGASTSYLQRRLAIGYSRAAKIIDQMTDKGYIAQANGSKQRKILITPEEFREQFGEEYDS